MKTLIPFLLILPCIVQAQIYHCSSRGDAYFSQIPCEDDSEAVAIEAQPLISEPEHEAVQPPEEPDAPVEAARTPADNLRDFVATLRKQRSEQVQQLDREIAALQSQLQAAGDAPEDSQQRETISGQLSDLQASRSSVVEQYESMIAEAERRVSALSGQTLSVQN